MRGIFFASQHVSTMASFEWTAGSRNLISQNVSRIRVLIGQRNAFATEAFKAILLKCSAFQCVSCVFCSEFIPQLSEIEFREKIYYCSGLFAPLISLNFAH